MIKDLIKTRNKVEMLALGPYNSKELRQCVNYRKILAANFWEKRFKVSEATLLIRQQLIKEKKLPRELVKIVVTSKQVQQDFLEARLKTKLRYQFKSRDEYVRETLALLDRVINESFSAGNLNTVLEAEKLRAKVLGLLIDRVGLIIPRDLEERVRAKKAEYATYREGLASSFRDTIESQKTRI